MREAATKAGSAEWTYSHYRATLLRNGEFFAIVTPDGRNDLSPENAKILLDALNNERRFRSALERIAGLDTGQLASDAQCSAVVIAMDALELTNATDSPTTTTSTNNKPK